MSLISDIAAYIPARYVRPLRVFLCYAVEDYEDVASLYRRLRAEGFAPWMDKEDLLGGQNWKRQITAAIETSDAVVVCLSPIAIKKIGYFHTEVKLALEVAARQPPETIFLVPLKIEGCELPQELNTLHAVDLRRDRNHEMLLRALRARAESLRETWLASTWRDPVVELDDFTPKLVRAVQNSIEAVVGELLKLERRPPRPSRNPEFMENVNARILALARPEPARGGSHVDVTGLHVDITCLDEDEAYFIHPWVPNRGRTHEEVWWAMGKEFSLWVWERVHEMERGVLMWHDDLNGDKRYLRKTMVSFHHLRFGDGSRWTVIVEGHDSTLVASKR